MKVKKFVFFFLFFTHVINLAEEKGSDNKNITVSTIKEDNLINEMFLFEKELLKAYSEGYTPN